MKGREDVRRDKSSHYADPVAKSSHKQDTHRPAVHHTRSYTLVARLHFSITKHTAKQERKYKQVNEEQRGEQCWELKRQRELRTCDHGPRPRSPRYAHKVRYGSALSLPHRATSCIGRRGLCSCRTSVCVGHSSSIYAQNPGNAGTLERRKGKGPTNLRSLCEDTMLETIVEESGVLPPCVHPPVTDRGALQGDIQSRVEQRITFGQPDETGSVLRRVISVKRCTHRSKGCIVRRSSLQQYKSAMKKG